MSVSPQRDTERALIGKESGELPGMPGAELVELAGLLHTNGGIGTQPEGEATVLDRQLHYHGMTATRTIIPHR